MNGAPDSDKTLRTLLGLVLSTEKQVVFIAFLVDEPFIFIFIVGELLFNMLRLSVRFIIF